VSVLAFERNAVVVASAGTGKTHTLVGVLVHLLLGEGHREEPVVPSRIVATTFSRRAAREIRERLARELEALAEAPEGSRYFGAIEDTRRSLGRAPVVPRELSKRAARALAYVDDVVVGTLHGFSLGLLRSFAVEAGMPYGVEVSDAADVRARAHAAIVRALETRMREGDAACVRALVGLAGGIEGLVGKLRGHFDANEELGLRTEDLGVSPEDVQVVERRWQDLKKRVRAVASLDRYDAAARAFESAFRPGEQVPYDVAEAAISAITAVRKSPKAKSDELELHAFLDTLPRPSDKKKTKVERLYCAYELRDEIAGHTEQLRGILAACETELVAARREAGGLGFGEVLGKVHELLETRPDVAIEIGRRFDVLLVDEFQDTSWLQKRIVELLWAEPSAHGTGKRVGLSDVRKRGLFVVGDRKQSIYGFRGADVSVFAELCVGLAGREAREKLRVDAGVVYEPPKPVADFFPLRVNRRSEPEILAFVNAFSERCFASTEEKRELFELCYSAEIEDLLAPQAERSTTPSPSRVVWVRPKLREMRSSGDKAPRLAMSTTRRDEARATTNVIRALVSGDRPVALANGRTVASYKDCAVLALTNEMLDEMAYALAEADVPYVLAGKSFYRAREVLDLTALLSLLVDPGDRLAALTVLRGPFASVSDTTLVALTDPGRGLRRVSSTMLEGPRAHLLAADEPDRGRVLAVVNVVERISPLLGRIGPGAALRAAAVALRFEETLAALPRGRGKVANVRKLMSLADRETDPRALVARVATRAQGTDDEGEASTFSEEDDAVRLLTVHGSKGLDFPIVFFPQAGAVVTDAGRAGAFVVERDAGPLSREADLGTEPSPSRGPHASLGVRLVHPSGLVVDTPAYERARAMDGRRDRAERKRLLYVALTRASHMLFLVGFRRPSKSGSTSGDTACSAVLDAVRTAPSTAELLTVEDEADDATGKPVPSSTTPSTPASPTPTSPTRAPKVPESPRPAPVVRLPAFRTLTIAPTSLQDFHHCPRRFQLVHLYGLPEHGRGARGADRSDPSAPAATSAARAAADAPALGQTSTDEGTRIHRVLERLPTEVLGGALGEAATLAAVSSGLAREGIPREHPRHAPLTQRLGRFVRGTWLAGRVARGATLHRELTFAIHVPIGDIGSAAGEPRALLRGAMDLVVVTDHEVAVVDYKRARGPGLEPYGFQLELYVLAARSLFPDARSVKAGVVFLGGDPETPLWLPEAASEGLASRVSAAAIDLEKARWNGHFPRAPHTRCEAIHCGYVGRCYPRALEPDIDFPELEP
jgi:ATP-dependent helicase/nuclease subunit A